MIMFKISFDKNSEFILSGELFLTIILIQLQNYFRREYRRIFQWLILSSGLASREENGHTL